MKSKDENSTIEQTDITARLADVNMRLSEEAIKYVKENPDQECSVILIQTFFSDPDDTRKIDELMALLDPKLKSFYLFKELEHYSNRVKRTSLGAEAPDFSLRNIYGQPVSLDSFHGKYLLLAFTAPWCDMCHTED
ncbi:antioxidant, AhpC/TSA family, partial [gut metagenome]